MQTLAHTGLVCLSLQEVIYFHLHLLIGHKDQYLKVLCLLLLLQMVLRVVKSHRSLRLDR